MKNNELNTQFFPEDYRVFGNEPRIIQKLIPSLFLKMADELNVTDWCLKTVLSAKSEDLRTTRKFFHESTVFR